MSCPRFPMSFGFSSHLISLAASRPSRASVTDHPQPAPKPTTLPTTSQPAKPPQAVWAGARRTRAARPYGSGKAAAPARGTLRHSSSIQSRCQLTLCDEPNSHLVPDATAAGLGVGEGCWAVVRCVHTHHVWTAPSGTAGMHSRSGPSSLGARSCGPAVLFFVRHAAMSDAGHAVSAHSAICAMCDPLLSATLRLRYIRAIVGGGACDA